MHTYREIVRLLCDSGFTDVHGYDPSSLTPFGAPGQVGLFLATKPA